MTETRAPQPRRNGELAVLVLQGGSTLSAYQAGAYEELAPGRHTPSTAPLSRPCSKRGAQTQVAGATNFPPNRGHHNECR